MLNLLLHLAFLFQQEDDVNKKTTSTRRRRQQEDDVNKKMTSTRRRRQQEDDVMNIESDAENYIFKH